ncbi:MAG TPA: glucose-6-phosphate dehydrogenase [Acidimicrobiales bacterium]|nr:glucose-6-phosphate dehydrogenase [Acidimicrobiales bacterium]
MTARRLVVLGATGDLTGRYLLPALAELAAAGALPSDLALVGVAREPWDAARYRQHAADRLDRHAAECPRSLREGLVERLSYVAGDVADPSTLSAAVGADAGASLVYLALPPALFAPAIEGLAAVGLSGRSRVVVEKPFGIDLASARALNRLLAGHFPEEAVFRMDHFLGKQTVQNILGVRFANRLFEPVWNRQHVAAVDIVWDETVALEGRAGYYDHSGALRDMIQNHLLQLLCLVAMERPAALDAKELRDRKVEVLRAVRSLTPGEVAANTVRARYGAGRIGDRDVPHYTEEPGVDPRRETETFAEVTLSVDNERWRGVPYRLRTGKALGADRREIAIRFRAVPDPVFGQVGEPPVNRLVLRMDPDRMTLELALNGAGDPFCVEEAALGLTLAPQELSAYARLILDAIEGDPALSIRGDEAEECWRIVEPILAEWKGQGTSVLRTYPAGSAGPERSDGSARVTELQSPGPGIVR